MKILQVIPDLRKGGAERIVIDICNELMIRGAEVLLLNFRPENHYGFLTGKINRQVVPASYVPSVRKKPLENLDAYRAAVKQFQPDVIHSHLYEAEMVTRQVIVPGIKYVTHLHSNFGQLEKISLTTFLQKSSALNYFERRLLLKQYQKCSNNFIAISTHTKEYYDKVLPEDLKRLQVIYNAIDYKRFYKAEKNTLPGEGINLISAGSLVPRKNHLFLIKVVEQLHKAGIPARLVILGEGEMRKKIEEAIRKAHLQEHVSLPGNVEHVEEYLHRSDIYVHSANYEPFGLVILEGMAAGLPCVMLDAMGNRDIADDGKNCFMVKQDDVKGFTDALKKIIGNPSLYAKMSEYAKQYARQFDIVPYVGKLVKFYEGCMKAP